MDVTLSLIIPIYKTEKYLNQCIDSILNQYTENIEIILVDDGSPDNCPEICDKYVATYPNIKVIHKKNEGLSCARNTGLSEAMGDYIWFIDSDDYIKDNAIATVLNEIHDNQNIDVFSSGLIWYFEKDGTSKAEKIPYGVLFHGKGEYLWNNCPAGASQRFVCKREFLIENNLYFYPGILHEDGEWGCRMLYLSKNVKIIDRPIYVYRNREKDSIMRSIKIKSAYDLIKGHQLLKKFMDENVSKDDIKKYRQCIWKMIRAIDYFCKPLFYTNDFDKFLQDCYPYIKSQAKDLVKDNPFKIRNWIYLLIPYTRFKILKLIRR